MSLVHSLIPVAVLALVTCVPQTFGDREDLRTIEVLGETRSFIVYAPPGIEPSGLLIAFHGSQGTGAGLRRGSDLDRVARELGVVVAYPDASHANWAEDCGGCTSADVVHLQADTALVSAIGAALSEEFNLPDRRWLAVGFSQGGLFTQRLACQMADRFRAVAIIAQTMAVTLSQRCEPTSSVGLLDILSFTDPLVPWEGNGNDVSSYMGALATVRTWHTINDCRADHDVIDEGGIIRYRYQGCRDGVGLELIGVVDGGHSWDMSSQVDVGSEIVRFFGSETTR